MAQKKQYGRQSKPNVKAVMEELNKQIAEKNLKQFYLLVGSEAYLKRQFRDNLAAAVVKKEDTMNYSYFLGDKLDIEQVLDLGATLPFFAEKRVIVLENTGLFDSKSQEGLKERFDSFPASTHVIFVEQKMDGRNSLSTWMKKKEAIYELNTPDEASLRAWIKQRFEKSGKQIGLEAANYLLEHVGTDMLLLEHEIEKLVAYQCDSPKIGLDDIKEICVSQAEDKMFDMIDAIVNRNQDKALRLYHDLLVLREPAMKVLVTLTKHYREMMQICLLQKQGKGNGEIAEILEMKNRAFVIPKYAAQGKNYTYAKLKSILDKCQETEQGIKTGKIQDIIGVELLIVEFSGAL